MVLDQRIEKYIYSPWRYRAGVFDLDCDCAVFSLRSLTFVVAVAHAVAAVEVKNAPGGAFLFFLRFFIFVFLFALRLFFIFGSRPVLFCLQFEEFRLEVRHLSHHAFGPCRGLIGSCPDRRSIFAFGPAVVVYGFYFGSAPLRLDFQRLGKRRPRFVHR